jgi:hypothetical protein
VRDQLEWVADVLVHVEPASGLPRTATRAP